MSHKKQSTDRLRARRAARGGKKYTRALRAGGNRVTVNSETMAGASPKSLADPTFATVREQTLELAASLAVNRGGSD
ncbi:hypothetical protein [Actinomadura terrae]|uniref:hypothetical protein n=1 Tax=Actinomadura terrae TaxID=604353 RepID=UPI001FA721A6|nr:hypothetical protein [Actinomadura terrae]